MEYDDQDAAYAQFLLVDTRKWLRAIDDGNRQSFCNHFAESIKNARYLSAVQHVLYSGTAIWAARQQYKHLLSPVENQSAIPLILSDCSGYGSGLHDAASAAQVLQTSFFPRRLDWPTTYALIDRLMGVGAIKLFRAHDGGIRNSISRYARMAAYTSAYEGIKESSVDADVTVRWTDSRPLAESYRVLSMTSLFPPSTGGLGDAARSDLAQIVDYEILRNLSDVLNAACENADIRAQIFLSELERLANYSADLSTMRVKDPVSTPVYLQRLREALIATGRCQIVGEGTSATLQIPRESAGPRV